MLDNLKINNQKEILFNSFITRANSELMLILHAEQLAVINNTTKEYEYNQLIERREEIINTLVENATKYV